MPTTRRLIALALFAALLAPTAAAPLYADADAEKRLDDLRDLVATRHEENARKYANNKDMLVYPGLIADRKARRVTLTAAAAALSHRDPIEFFLIPENSVKDHETLALTFAKPSQIHEAMQFIGMKPGRPVNYDKLHLWPKGERVAMIFHWHEPPASEGQPSQLRSVRAETLVHRVDEKDNRTPLPATGLLYTGSYMTTNENTGQKVLAADISDSMSIASTYNEPSTLFDLPYRAPQSDVYGSLQGNPNYRFKRYDEVTITIEPLDKPGHTRVLDLDLKIYSANKGPAGSLKQLGFALYHDKKQLNPGRDFQGVITTLARLSRENKDPFVTAHVDGQITVQAVKQMMTLLSAMQSHEGMRLEAPPEGQLFHEAFMPPDHWRDRKKRLLEPWELHLSEDGSDVPVRLLDVREEWLGGGKSKITETPHEVKTPEDVARIVKEQDDKRPRAIFVFTPANLLYEDLLAWLTPAMKTHEVVYVFLPEEQKAN